MLFCWVWLWHNLKWIKKYSYSIVYGRIPTHDALKKELQDLGVTKIPSSNKIQKQIENLESEQAATVREKQELQKKQKTLDIIQQNFTALLDAPEMQIPVPGKEPTL